MSCGNFLFSEVISTVHEFDILSRNFVWLIGKIMLCMRQTPFIFLVLGPRNQPINYKTILIDFKKLER